MAFFTPTPESHCDSTVVGMRITRSPRCAIDAGVAGGVLHRAAADDEHERLPIEPARVRALEHAPIDVFGDLRALAAGHDLRLADQREAAGVCSCVARDGRDHVGPRVGDAVVDHGDEAVHAVGFQARRGAQQHVVAPDRALRR